MKKIISLIIIMGTIAFAEKKLPQTKYNNWRKN
jgi:hypothetical protein